MTYILKQILHPEKSGRAVCMSLVAGSCEFQGQREPVTREGQMEWGQASGYRLQSSADCERNRRLEEVRAVCEWWPCVGGITWRPHHTSATPSNAGMATLQSGPACCTRLSQTCLQWLPFYWLFNVKVHFKNLTFHMELISGSFGLSHPCNHLFNPDRTDLKGSFESSFQEIVIRLFILDMQTASKGFSNLKLECYCKTPNVYWTSNLLYNKTVLSHLCQGNIYQWSCISQGRIED